MNKEEIIIQLSKIFENLSDPVRKKLIGEKIDNILEKFFDRISSYQLASALLSRYGSELFKPKYGVLESVIFRLNEKDIKKIANYLNIDNQSNDIYDEIVKLAKSSKNLKLFIDYFDLPDYFLQDKPKDNRKTSEVIDLEYEQHLKSKGYPHEYQNLVKLELIEKFNNSSGKYSALIVMPTGSGKTRTAIEFIIDYIRNVKKSNILWIVDGPELAEQSLKSFKELWELRGDRLLEVFRCFGSFEPQIDFNKNTNVIFSGFDKVFSLKENNSGFYKKLSYNTNLIIIDEAHFSLAETYENVITDIEKNSPDICKIGLTATPMRPNDNEFYNLKSYFNNTIIDFKDKKNNVIEDPLKYLQDLGYLANLKIEYLSIPENDINESSRGLNEKVIERIKNSILIKKQIIVFAMSKNHAIALDILLKHNNFNCACIVGETSPKERQIYFKDFTDKKINVLINYDILSTGIDLPKVDELLLLRKFGQYTTAMQVVGRALRGEKNGGNKMNSVISIKSNFEIIDDPSDLYNLIKNMY